MGEDSQWQGVLTQVFRDSVGVCRMITEAEDVMARPDETAFKVLERLQENISTIERMLSDVEAFRRGVLNG